MPSTIPYDPRLVLADIVSQDTLDNVKQISKYNAPVDAAEEHLNSLLASKRGLDMTKTELQNLGIPTTDIDPELDSLKSEITKAAADYAKEKMTAEREIQPLRARIHAVDSQVESPVDYLKSDIKKMPLASDSVSMDVQYFSMDSNKQDATSHASKVSGFVSGSTSWMGAKASVELTAATHRQVNEQAAIHGITGTLVFSVSCTHKNASMLAPFVLNVDKGIKVWNSLFQDDKIDPTSTKGMVEMTKSSESENKFSIISGTTFGSSFVGMVHVLENKETKVKEDLSAFSTSLKAQMNAGAWFKEASGGFGVETSFANDVKSLLSSQNVSSHVTLTSMGVIPSMVANEVKMGVKEFANFDPASNMEAIATIQNATNGDQDSVKQAAETARTGGKMQSMKSNDIKAALSALSDIDDGANKILDINSMMTALDDYIKKAAEGECGVPLNYYLKDITKDMLAEMWVAKYYPGQYMAIKYDDSEDSGQAQQPEEPSE